MGDEESVYRGFLYAASKDVSAISVLAEHLPDHTEVISSHAQQAAEKMV